MEVSVIIPTYGRTSELREAIESVRKQSTQPAELIIIDEDLNSSVGDFISNISFSSGTNIKYFNGQYGGLTASKNVAAEKSTGDIVLFIDDDAELHSDAIKNLIIVYERINPDGVWLVTDEQPTIAQRLYTQLFHFGPFNYGLRERELNKEETGVFTETDAMGGCGMSVRSYVLDEFKFDESDPVTFLPEDIDFSYRMKENHKIGATAIARKDHKRVKRNNLSKQELERGFYRKPYSYNYLYTQTLNRNPKFLPHYLIVNIGILISAIYVGWQNRTIAPILGFLKGVCSIIFGNSVEEEYLQ
ncbi:glycosyltransferase family 2 protein [Halorussus sp. MSC15.2]|uniref:glycosyltransferase family 2 protein n=1 Tax=Halorussus sp. MSC15.2 TaxID=2283638 RepID=UPI0013D6DD56|nr:glycosyltransferase family 2 protein [Halorussus sp. MSC15.2]NEU55654.1 glycosyltransferase family 2 protein [Halorussus sp. MSC15.2]